MAIQRIARCEQLRGMAIRGWSEDQHVPDTLLEKETRPDLLAGIAEQQAWTAIALQRAGALCDLGIEHFPIPSGRKNRS
jgi:hypothetical protein